jgi:hypothetical protein
MAKNKGSAVSQKKIRENFFAGMIRLPNAGSNKIIVIHSNGRIRILSLPRRIFEFYVNTLEIGGLRAGLLAGDCGWISGGGSAGLFTSKSIGIERLQDNSDPKGLWKIP